MEMETESASGDDNVELSHLIRDLEIESFSSSRIYDVSLSSQIAELFKRIIFELKTEEQEVNENEQCLKDKNLDHDISLEKACLKEKESIRAKDKLDRGKDGIEKRKDKGRKSEAILNYEQGRIKTVNDDLKKQSTEIESLNLEIVGPELDKKKLDVKVTKEESEASQKEIEKAATLSEELMMQLKEAESGHARLEELLGERENDERQISNEPSKLREELHGVQKSILDLKVEYQSLQENVSDYRTKILEQNSIRRDCITLRSDLEDKIQTCNRISTEEEQQYASISKDITMAQTKQHSHATTRLQLEIRLKESKESLRHQSNVTMLQKKQYDRIERVYVKKKYTLKKTIDLLAQMTLNLEESERHVRHEVKENEIQLKAIEDMKDEMNLKLTRWLEQENIEQTMKDELKSIAGNVEEKENETQKWRVEGGKLLKLLSITKIQRDTQIRKIRDVRTNAKETVEATKLKKLLVLDLAKVLLETNRRIEEFSALYEILKNERDEITSSTSEFSSQLLELHQKVKMQQTELQTLSNTKELKKTVLIKEKDAYESSRAQRATLRVEKTDVREIFRQKREEVDRQLVKVNRARAALSALKREQESLKNRNTRLRRSKKIMSKQLEDRKKDIHKLLQRANIYEEILKQGEVKIQEKKEDMRALVLQSVDIERYLSTKRLLDKERKEYEQTIVCLRGKLEIERKQKDALSDQLEDPNNRNGWRELDGHDLDEEQLVAKIHVLFQRFSKNKDRILEKEMMIEELDENIILMEKEAKLTNIKVQPTIKKLNECKYRLRDITRSMMALVSELSMYQATAIKLEEEKRGQEEEYTNELVCAEIKSIPHRSELEDVTNHNYDYEKIYYPAPYALRTTAEPRPISYISEANLGLPKPYGSMAPFKPSDCAGGTTMRHIRPPAMKQLL